MSHLTDEQHDALLRILAKLIKAGLMPSLCDMEIFLTLLEENVPQNRGFQETGGQA
jgi:hypothetical protein